jgi:alpha-beta hydrolase superfamily lysophospholipase
MEERVQWKSAGLELSGIVEFPEGMKRGERRAAMLVLHGFGSNKDNNTSRTVARIFTSLGYVALRFDMRGCGESEGERGRVICLEQVADTSSALNFLLKHESVNPERIAVFGHSFGAAVAVYAAGTDPRIAACISSGGWGHGEKKFRRQHESPQAWQRFRAMMEEGRRRKQRGERMMVPRFDIVPIRPELRSNLAPGSILEFPFEVVESMYAFTANEVVGKIAPRPLLLLHPANDTVTPTEQSIDLFAHAGQPTDLHLFADVDHFLFSDDNPMVHAVVRDWLKRYFPA